MRARHPHPARAGFALLALAFAHPDAVTSLARPFVWGFPPVLIVAALGPERVHAPTLPTRAAAAIGDVSYAKQSTSLRIGDIIVFPGAAKPRRFSNLR